MWPPGPCFDHAWSGGPVSTRLSDGQCVSSALARRVSLWTEDVMRFVVVFPWQQWYTSTMNLVGTWLTDRMDLQLHVYQLKILIRIVKVRAGFFILFF